MRRVFDYCFLALGLVIQVVTFCVSNLSPISLISGLLGICSVCLASQGNILTFAFGFAQVITYTYLCWTQRFYAEIAINAYYFGTMIYGVYVWRKRLGKDGQDLTVVPRSVSPLVLLFIALATLSSAWLISGQ